MSFRHFILDNIAPRLQHCGDAEVDDAVSALLAEHAIGVPSLEERCARAEALAILLVEKLNRIESKEGMA